jgi:hypothetical protein
MLSIHFVTRHFMTHQSLTHGGPSLRQHPPCATAANAHESASFTLADLPFCASSISALSFQFRLNEIRVLANVFTKSRQGPRINYMCGKLGAFDLYSPA